jgi:hypothetical protein
MAKVCVALLYNDLQAVFGKINALEGKVNEIRKGMALKDERIMRLEGEMKKKR